MDLSGLIKIRDGVYDERKTNVDGLEVSKRNGTILDDAIDRGNTIKNRLKIRDKNFASRKVSRIQSISRQQPTTKTKYVVLDSRAINEIADMSNAQRRNFLAHLSDSDRRRVLRAIRVKDNLEDGELKRKDINRELEVQDLYVINDLLTKFAYSRKDDELRMLESYKDLLDETDGQELAVLTLINKVIDGDLDLEADADTINDVFTFLEENGFETDSLDASLAAGFGDTYGSTDVELGDEDLDGEDEDFEDEPELDIEGDLGDEDEGFDEEPDLDSEEDLDEGGEDDLDLKINLGDSAKRKPIVGKRIIDTKREPVTERKTAKREPVTERKPVERANRIADTKKPKKSFEQVEANIINDSYDLAKGVLKNEVTNILDSSNKIIEKYSELTGEPVRVKDTFDRAFTCSLNKIADYMHGNSQKIKDDIIDQIDETLGDDSVESEGKTLLESLGSALEAFAQGDNSELQALAELSLDDIQPEEDFDTIEGDGADEFGEDEEGEDVELGGDLGDEEVDGFGDEEDEEDEEEEDDEPKKIKLNVHDSVINLAKALLNNDKKANQYIDKLKDSVDILRKINFKISDSEFMEEEEEYIQPDIDVVEPILTREEFQSTYESPLYVGEMAKEANPAACVNPTAVNYGESNPIIQVECNGIVQNWIPITGSNEKVVEQLQQEGVDVAKTISDNCVPVEDYYAAAAKTNNLGLIDGKFYKKKLSDNTWVCDGIADCVAGCEGVGEGATFVQSGITTMPKVVPSGSVLIYGTKYDYYNKVNK